MWAGQSCSMTVCGLWYFTRLWRQVHSIPVLSWIFPLMNPKNYDLTLGWVNCWNIATCVILIPLYSRLRITDSLYYSLLSYYMFVLYILLLFSLIVFLFACLYLNLCENNFCYYCLFIICDIHHITAPP